MVSIIPNTGTTTHTWTDLEETDTHGGKYEYRIEEVNTPPNYVNRISEDGLTITNTYGSPKTFIVGGKVWENGPSEKPTIELQLYRNREEFKDPVKLVNGILSHTWNDLDLTDSEGVEYVYTVDEVKVPENYEKTVEGLTVTNTYVVPKGVGVTGTKVWVGGPEAKPTIKLQLLQNGIVIETIELDGTGDNKWSYTWENLDRTDEHGNVYEYTVDEEDVENYGKERVSEGLKFTITNTYKSPTTEITARKVWENGGLNRPDYIEFQLYRKIEGAEKEKVGAPVKLSKGIHEYSWKEQPINDNQGNKYTYTVEEVEVPDNYTSVADGLTVTNTYVIPKIEITGTKVWVGGSSNRPTIELQLYRDGVKLGDTVKLESGTTEYTWTDLDKTDADGKEYKYTVDEVNTPRNYTKSISEDGLTIINRYRRPTDPTEPGRPTDPEEPGRPTNPPTDPEPEPEPEGPIIQEVPDLDPDPEPEEPLVPIVLDPPAKGTVTFDEDGNWIYTPNPGETGKDSFTLIHPDGTEELIEIDLDDVALGTASPDGPGGMLPKTGEGSNLGFYFTGLLLIVLGLFLRKRIA